MARDARRLIEDVKQARADFEARLDDLDAAKEKYYDAVRRVYNVGVPLREIADAIGVSHQRVHQIVGEEAPRTRVRRVVARGARAAGVSLLLILFAGWWAAATQSPQPRADALADIRQARGFMESHLPDEVRSAILPGIDEMLDQVNP